MPAGPAADQPSPSAHSNYNCTWKINLSALLDLGLGVPPYPIILGPILLLLSPNQVTEPLSLAESIQAQRMPC